MTSPDAAGGGESCDEEGVDPVGGEGGGQRGAEEGARVVLGHHQLVRQRRQRGRELAKGRATLEDLQQRDLAEEDA
jgi:hypothetical protein